MAAPILVSLVCGPLAMYKLWTEQEQEKGKKREFKSTTGMQLGGPFTLVDFNGRAGSCMGLLSLSSGTTKSTPRGRGTFQWGALENGRSRNMP